jgi:ferredoxin
MNRRTFIYGFLSSITLFFVPKFSSLSTLFNTKLIKKAPISVKITEECIACGACEAECPNNGIYEAGKPYTIGGKKFPALSDDYTYIVPEKCTECVGFHDEPQCIPACPTGAIIIDPNHIESYEALLKKKELLDRIGR